MNNEEKIKSTESTENVVSAESADPKPAVISDPQEAIRKMAMGTIKLQTPIRAGGVDVMALDYDFSKLTGKEYADAMDKDANTMSMFRISNKQALCLFACAAAKVTSGIDARDIEDRIGIQDSIKAVQLATIFFVASAREGNKRITNG
ncbi:MAG: hypothetical protein PHI27_06525 [Eubacteriales bacterium]|nr:hypothetical protein [Eubacteriales bacterium]MDD4512864.1 hypothetical protein [Eubacteriales bacterium]